MKTHPRHRSIEKQWLCAGRANSSANRTRIFWPGTTTFDLCSERVTPPINSLEVRSGVTPYHFFERPAFRASLLFSLALGWWPALLSAQAPVPTITASPAVLSFTYQTGGTKLPTAQAVSLKSNTTGLTASLAISGDYNGDWVTSSTRPGVTFALPSTITITVTPTGLAAGIYTATMAVTSTTSTGPITQVVTITLAISAPASTLHFSPASLPAFNYTTGATAPPASQQFLIYSDGAAMQVTISASSSPWLTLNPTGSVQLVGLMKPITVSIDPTNLAKLVPKTYTATITVTAPTATNKSTTYAVTLNVNAAAPTVTGTWPDGIVVAGSASTSSTIVVNGSNFFDTSTISATGFTNSALVTVTDSSTTPLTASETIQIPVYSATASGMRLTMGSPLPTAYVGTVYSVDLSGFVAGGTSPYTWSATGLPKGILISAAGTLTGVPASAGNYNVEISAVDLNGRTAYMPVSLSVYASSTPATGSMWITVNSILPAGVVGTTYTANLNVNGGTDPFNWTTDASAIFPAGLSIAGTGNPGVVSGTPSTVGPLGSLTAKKLSDGALQVTIPTSYFSKQGVLRMAVTTPTPGGGVSNDAQLGVYGPEPRILAVGNAASYAEGTVSPGELITIFGTGLGPANLTVYDPNNASLPQSLPSPAPATGVTRIQFTAAGVSYYASLLYVSATQIGAMVPFEVAGNTSVQMVVTYAGLSSKSYPLSVAPTVPGIFSADGTGKGQGAILNFNSTTNDYAVNGSNSQAIKGAIVIMYVTGFGVTVPASNSWTAAGAGYDTASAASVTIDGKSTSVVSAVPAGSFPGVLQLNVTVPSDASSGKAIPVTVNIGGKDAQTGVTMAIK
jgi:uncharacterized protein (TIGR03437 family)